MTRRPGFSAALAIILMAFPSCVRLNPPALDEPPVILERLLFSTSVIQKDGWAKPSGEKMVFSRGADARIYAFLSFRTLREAHFLSWKWYAPSQALHRASDKITVGEEGKAFERYIAWDTILVLEATEAGTWTVAVFLDDRLLVTGWFEIK